MSDPNRDRSSAPFRKVDDQQRNTEESNLSDTKTDSSDSDSDRDESVLDKENSGDDTSDATLSENSISDTGTIVSDASEESDRDDQTIAQLVGRYERTDDNDDTGYEWPKDMEQRLEAKQRLIPFASTGTADLPKWEIEKLKDRGYFVTKNLSGGVGGELYEAFTHPDLEFEVPIDPICGEMGWDASYVRNVPVKWIRLGEGTPCALKRIDSELFELELKIMLLLNHPNCVKLYGTVGFGEGINRINFLVMEYLNGGTDFTEFMSKFNTDTLDSTRKKLDDWTARLIIKHVVLGLAYLHSLGIVHDDLHGGNIMPHYDKGRMVWKLLDFGLAKTESHPDFQYYEDFASLFDDIINEVLTVADMDDHNSEGIRAVMDNTSSTHEKLRNNLPIDAQDIDTMEKVAQALEPFFPPEDRPPIGSVAYEFCQEHEE